MSGLSDVDLLANLVARLELAARAEQRADLELGRHRVQLTIIRDEIREWIETYRWEQQA